MCDSRDEDYGVAGGQGRTERDIIKTWELFVALGASAVVIIGCVYVAWKFFWTVN